MLEAGAGAVKLQAEGSPAVVDRALAYGIDSTQAVATFRCTRLNSSTCVTCHSLSMRCHVALLMQQMCSVTADMDACLHQQVLA